MKLAEIKQIDEMHPMTGMMMHAMGDDNPEKTMDAKKKADKLAKAKKKKAKGKSSLAQKLGNVFKK